MDIREKLLMERQDRFLDKLFRQYMPPVKKALRQDGHRMVVVWCSAHRSFAGVRFNRWTRLQRRIHEPVL